MNHAEGHCSDSENRSKIHLTAAELGTESREARGVEDGSQKMFWRFRGGQEMPIGEEGEFDCEDEWNHG